MSLKNASTARISKLATAAQKMPQCQDTYKLLKQDQKQNDSLCNCQRGIDNCLLDMKCIFE